MRTVTPISLHTQTMLELLKIYRPDLQISVVSEEKSILIKVEGLAIPNKF